MLKPQPLGVQTAPVRPLHRPADDLRAIHLEQLAAAQFSSLAAFT